MSLFMDNAQEFIPIKKVTKIYGVSSQVLRKWEDAGVLESIFESFLKKETSVIVECHNNDL